MKKATCVLFCVSKSAVQVINKSLKVLSPSEGIVVSQATVTVISNLCVGILVLTSLKKKVRLCIVFVNQQSL